MEEKYERASITVSKKEKDAYLALAEEIRKERGFKKFSLADLTAEAINHYKLVRSEQKEGK